jgi:hypothetical protein
LSPSAAWGKSFVPANAISSNLPQVKGFSTLLLGLFWQKLQIIRKIR